MAQKYRLIYCAVIDDDKHAGMLKIGDTEFVPNKPVNTYIPNEDGLKKEAEARIRAWSGTAAAGAKLVYCEALIRYNDMVQNYETYRDSSVHTVLQHSGFPKVDFDSENDSGREWFTVDLETVKAAIKATKEYRDYLDTSELPQKTIYNLREEQSRAVKETIARFEKKNDMLWHAKMRFGKTITALNLVKQKAFKRTIIITHRPVVEDSWGSDFYHVFSNEDKYAFLTKIQDAEMLLDEDQTDEAIDRANDARLTQLVNEDRSFVYFASIQDLRGSKLVGGKFDKNNIVFDIDWDLVIIDEAHEGTKTPLGQKVIDLLIKKATKRLDLSGTAYNLFDKYTEKGSVYTWDYVMEQEAKRNWSQKHPGEKNPYEDMPVMHINTFDLEKAIRENGLELEGKSFSFREFFRTWTGELGRDGQPVPEYAEIGDFVHPAAVRRFLDLLSQGDESSRFPYVTKGSCNQNRHSLWMVPGVKEAAALSKMLRNHPLFGQEAAFGIANVAGEGDHDEEKHYHNALALVRKTIASHPNSITLSCGRLTTGVTVKEWTSVFMLSGSETTDAKNYMQTIFRVQSAGKIDGKQKTDAYVYDFAPDRTLLVVASSVLGARKGKGGMVIEDDEREQAFNDFLEFCPIVAIDGAEFKPFNVESLMSQINRVQIDRALKTGFTDNAIYDMSQFKKLDKSDIEKMNAIFKKLKETKDKKPLSVAGMAKNGLEKGNTQTSKSNTSVGDKKEKDGQKELEKNILEKLRTISIRIPLLFYGGNFEIEEGRLGEIITGIDNTSWEVFMPSNLTKNDFLALVRYYNQSTVIGAGKIIRNEALKADEMTPTERVVAITNIFNHFHNPSKETVLTPWRVVNMHMADTLGGYRFFNSEYKDDSDEYYNRLLEPEFVDHGKITTETLGNPNAVIMEINSKSGLYPLYGVYSIYRAKLGIRKESELLPDELIRIWDEAIQQVYVLCQSSMAADITKRTLIGYRSGRTNVKYDEKLLENFIASEDESSQTIQKGSYWNKEVKKLKLDAIVGNPPYQLIDGSGGSNDAPIYQHFVEVAHKIDPKYVSLIIPSRWFTTGRENLLGTFRTNMLNSQKISKMTAFTNSREVFSNVEIKGGLCYYLYDSQHRGFCNYSLIQDGVKTSSLRNLGEFEILIREPKLSNIVKKVVATIKDESETVTAIISNDTPFGIPTNPSSSKKNTIKIYDSSSSSHNTLVLYLDKNTRKFAYVNRKDIKKNLQDIDKYKVFIPESGGSGTDAYVLGKPVFCKKNSVCSQTFLYAAFNTESEAKNFLTYAQTKFFRALVAACKISQHAPSKAYRFVPLQDFSQEWSDEKLYIRYALTSEEIEFIESTIKPMDVD